MPPASPGAILGLVLAAATLVAAAFLAFRQWAERRRRGGAMPVAEARYFARQDLRRWIGTVLMAALALGMIIASRLGPPRDRPAARLLVRTWIGICGLVVAVLTLALLDWVATTAYARRHRQELTRRHFAGLEAELRRHTGRRNGRPGTDGPPDTPPRS